MEEEGIQGMRELGPPPVYAAPNHMEVSPHAGAAAGVNPIVTPFRSRAIQDPAHV